MQYIGIIASIVCAVYAFKTFQQAEKIAKIQEQKEKDKENCDKFSYICVSLYNEIILYYRAFINELKKMNLFNDKNEHTLEEYMIEVSKLEVSKCPLDKELAEKICNHNRPLDKESAESIVLNLLKDWVLKQFEDNFKINDNNEKTFIERLCLFCINNESALLYVYNNNAHDVMQNLQKLNINSNKIKDFLKKNNFSEKEIDKIYYKMSISKRGFKILLPTVLYTN